MWWWPAVGQSLASDTDRRAGSAGAAQRTQHGRGGIQQGLSQVCVGVCQGRRADVRLAAATALLSWAWHWWALVLASLAGALLSAVMGSQCVQLEAQPLEQCCRVCVTAGSSFPPGRPSRANLNPVLYPAGRCGAVRACTSAWSTWWLRPRCAHKPTQSGTSWSASGQSEGGRGAQVVVDRRHTEGCRPFGTRLRAESCPVAPEDNTSMRRTCRRHTGLVREIHCAPAFGNCCHASHTCV